MGWMRRAFPGRLIQTDTKHLRFGERKLCQFTAMDCFFRVAFSQLYSSSISACTRAFLEEVQRYMPLSLLALKTDNGAELLRRFDKAIDKEIITHCFSHPYFTKESASPERKVLVDEYELQAFREGYTV